GRGRNLAPPLVLRRRLRQLVLLRLERVVLVALRALAASALLLLLRLLKRLLQLLIVLVGVGRLAEDDERARPVGRGPVAIPAPLVPHLVDLLRIDLQERREVGDDLLVELGSKPLLRLGQLQVILARHRRDLLAELALVEVADLHPVVLVPLLDAAVLPD